MLPISTSPGPRSQRAPSHELMDSTQPPNPFALPDELVDRTAESRMVLLVLDGVGGLPAPGSGLTELEAANTPNLDALAARSSLGMQTPVAPGVTPGSGPGHLALFGYDPVVHRVGRGLLSALGVGLPLQRGDVAARLNLATFDSAGNVTDRRAGRPPDELGRRIVEKVASEWTAPPGIEVILKPVKEHRAVLVLRGADLDARIDDTDPQETGVPPLRAQATDPAADRTASMVQDLVDQARDILADEDQVHGFLARGFARFDGFPSLHDRFGLSSLVIAKYPMYRGVARLVGMEVGDVPGSDEETVSLVESYWGQYDFTFAHFKAPDARGEDGNFDAKVASIEAIDALIPRVVDLDPDVLLVTGDHSTPANMAMHSWHHVPVLLASKWARPTASVFGESSCRGGDLGFLLGKDLMSLMLAHAGRLEKYGA